MTLHDNLCQALRQSRDDCNFNNQSFNEDNHTIGRLIRGGGRVETLCSMLEQMGFTEVKYENNKITII